jgi:hypothetical protein
VGLPPFMATDTDVTQTAPQAHAPDAAARRFPATSRGWLAELAWLASAMVLSLVFACIILQVWDAQIRIPFVSAGDGLLNVVGLKTLVEHGWYFSIPDVGAPTGLKTFDFSAFDADNLQWIVIRILALGTSDPSVLLNVYYLLGYPMVAGTTYIVLRALGTSRPSSLAGAVVFSALPYHFLRGEGHLFLGNYFAVPAAGWLILRVLQRETLLSRRPGATGLRTWLTPVTAGTVAAILLAAGSTLYYAVFTILLVGSAALLRVITERRLSAGLAGVVVAVALGLVLLVNISPALIYQHEHGANTLAAKRLPMESEKFSTSLTQIVLPISRHRIEALSTAEALHQGETPAPGELGAHVGFLLALSFVGLLLSLLARSVRPSIPETREARLLAAASVAVAVAFLFATFGGISSLIAQFISPQIRAWSRLTPFIAFFALVGFVTVADQAVRRLRGQGSPWLRALAPGGLIAITVLALLDQTSPAYRPTYEANATVWRSDSRFVSQVQQQVPRGTEIVQLPFHAFPESEGDFRMVDYDLFKGYVHSTSLRWSYGAMKGRPGDWTTQAENQPLSRVLSAAVAAGFTGVYVDRYGYADGGVETEKQIEKTLGVSGPSVVSEDNRLAFFSASGLSSLEHKQLSAAQRTRLGESVIDPVAVSYAGELGPTEGADPQRWNWLGASGDINIDNDRTTPSTFRLRTSAASSPQTVLRIAVPGQPVKLVRFRHAKTRVDIRFTVPAGKSAVHLAVDGPDISGPDPRDLRVQLFSLRVGEDVAVPRLNATG